MRAGRLVSNIVIQRRKTGRLDTHGIAKETWEPVLATRAEIVSDSAQAFLRDYGEAIEGAAVFRIRYRDGIAPGDRVVTDARTSIPERVFEITEIAEVQRRMVLELRCRQGTVS